MSAGAAAAPAKPFLVVARGWPMERRGRKAVDRLAEGGGKDCRLESDKLNESL